MPPSKVDGAPAERELEASCLSFTAVAVPLALAVLGYAAFALLEPWDDGRCLLRASASAPPGSDVRALADFATQYYAVPYGLSYLVNGALADLGTPWRVADVPIGVHGMPCHGPLVSSDAAPLGGLIEDDDDATATDDAVARALVRHPLWETELLLPPEQLVALHLPLFVPAAVAVISAAFRVSSAVVGRHRRRQAELAERVVA